MNEQTVTVPLELIRLADQALNTTPQVQVKLAFQHIMAEAAAGVQAGGNSREIVRPAVPPVG